MKDEIKKKIEKEALKYAESKSSSSVFYESHVKDFIKGAEFMHSLAQSVNSELLEALKKCSSYLPYDKGLREEVKELILSASQNQQNEKESDAVEFADWLISTKWVKVINGIGYYTSKELYELFKQSKTNPPKEK
jgi:hypothetical protein